MAGERLYKRGRVWWGWVYVNGKDVYRSTKCRDRRAAETVVREWERAAADPTYAASHAATITGALARLVLERAERGKPADTLRMLETKGGHIVRLLGLELPLAKITPKAIDAYVSARRAEGAADATLYKEWSTLRGALRLAKRRGEFQGDLEALRPIGLSGQSKPVSRYLTPEQLCKLLPELLSDRGAHVLWIIATGARWSESTRARRADIDLARAEVRIRGTKTALAARSVPVVVFARPMLERVLELRGDVTGPLFRPWGNVRHDLAVACRRAGIEPVTPNDLRRTTATWLRLAGVEPHLIAAVLGHADSRMVERVYGRITPEALGEALAARLGCSTSVGTPAATVSSWTALAASKSLPDPRNLVPRDGIEPPTRGFSIRSLPHSKRPRTRGWLPPRSGFVGPAEPELDGWKGRAAA